MSDAKTPTLTEFLLACIQSDEDQVQSQECACDLDYDGTHHPSCIEYVFAQCIAKRYLVRLLSTEANVYALGLLAFPYREHDGYRAEWGPA